MKFLLFLFLFSGAFAFAEGQAVVYYWGLRGAGMKELRKDVKRVSAVDTTALFTLTTAEQQLLISAVECDTSGKLRRSYWSGLQFIGSLQASRRLETMFVMIIDGTQLYYWPVRTGSAPRLLQNSEEIIRVFRRYAK